MENKRLYRSRKDVVLSGVCGGIAEYFNIDPVVIRILWVIIGIGAIGTGVIAYIIAAMVIPKDPVKVKANKTPYENGEEFEACHDSQSEESQTSTNHSPVEKESGSNLGMVLGLLLIFVGGFVLVMNVFSMNIFYFVDLFFGMIDGFFNMLHSINYNYLRIFASYFWPICLILLGLVFLVKSK